MTLSVANGYLVSLIGGSPSVAGLALSYSAGSITPFTASPCIGVSLGASGQIALPGDIASCRVNPGAGPVADGSLLCLPIGVTTPYPQFAGSFIPLNDITAGTPVPYALAIADLPGGGGLVRALLQGADAVNTGPVPSPFPGYPLIANGFLAVATAGGAGVDIGPVPLGFLRLFMPMRILGNLGFEYSLVYTPVIGPSVTLLTPSASPNSTCPLPALVAGEKLTVTALNENGNMYVPYMDVPLVSQADNPVALATRATPTSAATFVINGPAIAGRARRNWSNKPQYMDAGNGASGAFGDYALTGLLIFNPDVIDHNVAIRHVGAATVSVFDSNVGSGTFVNPSFGGTPINNGDTLEIVITDPTNTTNVAVFALWTDQLSA